MLIRRTAFTMIELLVTTVVSLLLILAVTQAFAFISRVIAANRATLEMAGQLRGVTALLQRDLDQATARLEPWVESSWRGGYFETLEGPGNDWDADNDGTLLPNRPLSYAPDTGGVRNVDAMQALGDSSAGDVDDVLAFTVYSGADPFVGQVLGILEPLGPGLFRLNYDPSQPIITTISSHTAEVIWWTSRSFDDLDGDLLWDSGEPFRVTLHRRMLLVRPDIVLDADLQPYVDSNGNGVRDPSEGESQMPHPMFFSANDLSVHVNEVGNRVANSLSDLTWRQTRFAHVATFPNQGLLARLPAPAGTFPHPIDRSLLMPKRNVFTAGADGGWGVAGANDDMTGPADDVDEAGWIGSDDFLVRAAFGEDVVLANVLAFDVKVFDPGAQVRCHWGTDGAWGIIGVDDNGNGQVDEFLEAGSAGSDDAVVLPGDPAYYSRATPANTQHIGYGAYVDLGYLYPVGPFPAGLTIRSQFAGQPDFRSRLLAPTWDTWPFDYERDGWDQGNWVNPGNPLVDEGIDGIDNGPVPVNLNALGGIDEADERETAPPYNARLRGIQIKLRALDPDSRQLLQTTVRSEFTPE